MPFAVPFELESHLRWQNTLWSPLRSPLTVEWDAPRRVCIDQHFGFWPEKVDHPAFFETLISTYYGLGRTNSIFEYYLGRIVCELGRRIWASRLDIRQ